MDRCYISVVGIIFYFLDNWRQGKLFLEESDEPMKGDVL